MDPLGNLRRLGFRFATLILICLMFKCMGLSRVLEDKGCIKFNLSFGNSMDVESNYGEMNPYVWLRVGCVDGKAVTPKKGKNENSSIRKLLQVTSEGHPFGNAANDESTIPSQSPSPSPAPTSASKSPIFSTHSKPNFKSSPNVFTLSPSGSSVFSFSRSKNYNGLILFGSIGGFIVIVISVIAIIFFRTNKVSTVRPWATGLSGQLQKAFVTGVPKLKKSELETACEDFSNVVGTSSIGTVFKGILSDGVEIAVISSAITSKKDWMKKFETQFKKKIETLSKVNHKNFVNLLGYCKEDAPFARIMVFEYSPNGTLFEHLHVKESEHLDWCTRLRIAAGVAFCLDHLHHINPPFFHTNLNSSVINLTEDYAAKISDFSFSNELSPEIGPSEFELLGTRSTTPENNVYSFGLILLEIVTGKLPYSTCDDWAQGYLTGRRSLLDLVDPSLECFDVGQIGKIDEVIKSCMCANVKGRPTMKEVSKSLKSITGMTPDAAIPKLSALWWAELEIMSMEGN